MLFVPENYQAPENCTCGPENENSWDLVPDRIWGLSIKQACCIHDHMYAVGKTQQDKDQADRVFLANMLVLIDESKPNRLVRWLRYRTAYTYYAAVQHFGGIVFWNKEFRNPELKGA